MRLSSAVKALPLLYLLIADGLSDSQGGSPEIIGPEKIQMNANLGKRLIFHCDAFTNSEDDVTLIYWLVNGAFPDEIPSSNRLVESQESTLEDGAVIQRSLLLKNATSEDLKSVFTCIVTNASGMAKKHIKLTEAIYSKSQKCRSRKTKRNN